MSGFDDFEGVMATEFPDDLVEELISGGAYEPALPDDLLLVGRLLRAAQGPIPGEDRSRETEVVEAMITAMRVTPIAAPRMARRSVGRSGLAPRSEGRSGLAGRRALVAVTAAVSVLGVGGVAAAAGSLPAPIQSFVHDSLSYVGVSVPSTDTEPSPAEPSPAEPESINVEPPPPAEPATTTGMPTTVSDVSAPDQSGDVSVPSDGAPGNSGAAPGHSSDAPGNSGEAPGHSIDGPGQSDAPRDQSGEQRGKSDDAPGQSKEKESEKDAKDK